MDKNRPARRRFSLFRLFRKDRSGVSAIEFTLIFPILVAMFAGTVDLGQALMVSRKINQITSSTADIVAQNSSWASADVIALLKGMSTIIQPYSTTDLTIDVLVLNVDNKLNATVAWSKTFNGKVYLAGTPSPVPLPAAMATANVQMVLVKATFAFKTPFSSLLKPATGVETYKYDRYYFMRPRNSDTISLT